ncbi:hypothetical protein GCM10011371_04710 [Novosphingobium marinum]|uniref:ElaB/YqjD/DUF883 family membrane-anchored ribosome-binding protein n=1 Tax=Novosphingobium marinum TaxID=1514948 RepID=A0A7Z0BRU0_9SPHN|nr:hypothetical protein [Novosphingobium marinum]NYH94161.1 ElaB/YqjD/DUF883 family membrane-anchored ribosome-binding protein [Novosphingobium marinum]GGC20069.1 hypothetical protein GCM10011371_04710 [Novosphingobium marinum]
MADPTTTPETTSTAGAGGEAAKSHFAKAMEEAKAGARALRDEAQVRADTYRAKYDEKRGEYRAKYEETKGEAKVRGDEAKERAAYYANEGKTRASAGLSSLARTIEDNAAMIDEKVGPKYGDYARNAARSMNDTAGYLNERELEQLGEDAMDFVRRNPGLSVGIAAVGGFMLARMFKGSD